MVKVLITVLVVVLVLFGIYSVFVNRSAFLSPDNTQPLTVDSVTPTMTASDRDLDSDTAALDKDLLEIDTGERGFDQEVLGL